MAESEQIKPLKYSTVDQIEVLEGRGPWTTKSGSELMVLAALPIEIIKNYFEYDQDELDKMPTNFDVRGFRPYSNRGMPIGSKGGMEFHRIRQEIILGLEGETKWECEDLAGNVRKFTINPTLGIKFDPFILHTVEAKTDNCGFLVIANTLFIPEDPRTHDTYSKEIFKVLQQQ